MTMQENLGAIPRLHFQMKALDPVLPSEGRHLRSSACKESPDTETLITGHTAFPHFSYLSLEQQLSFLNCL